jgi:hypothetical protein
LEALARAIKADAPAAETALLICTAEDADFFAKGLLAELSIVGKFEARVLLESSSSPSGVDTDVAPIIRRYEEPSKTKLGHLLT